MDRQQESQQSRSLQTPSRVFASSMGWRAQLGVAALLPLVLMATGCRQSHRAKGGQTLTPTNNQVELNVDFGLRRDLVLGHKSLGDLLHVGIDGDAFDDLVETNFGPMKVTLSMGLADGTFLKTTELDTIGHPWRLTTGDFNADGMKDIAVATHRWPARGPSGTGTAAIQVFLQGPAQGEFSSIPITFSTLKNPMDVESAPTSGVKDTGGPGNRDELFVAIQDKSEVAQLTLDLTPGQGTPLVQVRTFSSANMSATGRPTSLALLDFDHDGLLDVLVGETSVPGAGDRLVRYHRSQTLSFAPAEFALGPLFSPVLQNIGDVDGDLRDDLSVAQLGATDVHLVTFDDTATPVLTTLNLGAQTTSLIFRDLDGDGLAEAVATTLEEDSIQVLPGTGPLAWGNAVHYSVGAVPRAIDIVFLPGDGVPDLLCGNAQDLSILVGLVDSQGQATGTFRGARGYRTMPAGFSKALIPSAVRMADLDKDGNQDLVIVSRRQFAISFLEGAGDGSFEAKKALPLVGTADDKPGFLVIADMDGNGLLDVVTTVQASDEVRLYRNTGTVGGFSEPTGIDVTPVAGGPLGLAVGRMDANNSPDIVVANAGDQSIQVLLNGGDGDLSARPPIPMGFSVGGVILGQLDNNASRDAVVVGWDGASNWLVAVMAGDGQGGLATVATHPLNGASSSLALGDFDENGLMDFAVAQGNSSGDELFVFFNQGGLNFTSTKVSVAPGPGHVIVSDVDNDGHQDLIVATQPGELCLLLGNGAGAFPKRIPGQIGELPLSHVTVHAAYGDVNGDGLKDIVTVSSQTPFVWVGLNTSTPVNQP